MKNWIESMKKLIVQQKSTNARAVTKSIGGPMRLDIARVACKDLFAVRIFRAMIYFLSGAAR